MLALIGGTGLARMDALRVERHHPAENRWGCASSPVIGGRIGEQPVLFLPRHGDPHALLPHQVNYRANIQALVDAGATSVLAVNAVGGITDAVCRSGCLVVPDQIIDYTWGRDSTFFDTEDSAVIHVDFSFPMDPALRRALHRALKDCALEAVDGGCYGATQGPRLETAAEIDRMERDGCDLVGMTGMPEAVLAREAGLPYAMLSLVVNPAAGRSDEEISMEAIQAVVETGMADVQAVIRRLATL